jgi:CHAD domain-containing protein
MEIEAKFDITSEKQAQNLHRARRLLGHPLLDRGEVTVIDTYFDTPQLHLARHGLSLRLRQLDQRTLVTLKSLGQRSAANDGANGAAAAGDALHIRQEIECELTPPLTRLDVFGITELPQDIRSMLAPLFPDPTAVRFAPLCQLHQRRAKRWLLPERPARARKPAPSAGQGAELQPGQPDLPIAEVSIDVVHYFPQSVLLMSNSQVSGTQMSEGQTSREQTDKVFRELEIELTGSSDQAMLQALSARLLRLPGLRSDRRSKLERVLGELLSNRTQIIDPELPAAELCRAIWQRQLYKILLNEAGVRQASDIEAVHDMRVAIRQMRGAARLFKPFFQRKVLAEYLKRLRHTARLLGPVRDLDVAILRLQTYCAEQELAPEQTAELHGLLESWRAARQQAHEEALQWLNSRRYARFIERFVNFCQTPGLGAKAQEQYEWPMVHSTQLRHVFPSILLEHYVDVRMFETMLFQPETPPNAHMLHALRIQCKYLRYGLEFVQNALGVQGKSMIEQLKLLQDLLGNLNDAVVTAHLLDEQQAKVGASSAVAHYRRWQDRLIEDLRPTVLRELQHFVSPPIRQTLLRALAML